MPSLELEVKGNPYHQRYGVLAYQPVQANLVTSFIHYPKSTFCLDSSLIGHSKPKLLCCINSSHTHTKFFPPKSMKPACFCHFLGPISIRPTCTQVKMCFFFSCQSVLFLFYYYSNHKNSRRVEATIFPSCQSLSFRN